MALLLAFAGYQAQLLEVLLLRVKALPAISKQCHPTFPQACSLSFLLHRVLLNRPCSHARAEQENIIIKFPLRLSPSLLGLLPGLLELRLAFFGQPLNLISQVYPNILATFWCWQTFGFSLSFAFASF